MKRRIVIVIALVLTIFTDFAWDGPAARADEPTTVIQRYYCIAGDAPISGDYFLAGHVDISATPISLWCQAVY